jgi:hypothetical protein
MGAHIGTVSMEHAVLDELPELEFGEYAGELAEGSDDRYPVPGIVTASVLSAALWCAILACFGVIRF